MGGLAKIQTICEDSGSAVHHKKTVQYTEQTYLFNCPSCYTYYMTIIKSYPPLRK